MASAAGTTVDVAAIPAHGSSCFCFSAAAETATALETATTIADVAAAAAANPPKPGRISFPVFLRRGAKSLLTQHSS